MIKYDRFKKKLGSQVSPLQCTKDADDIRSIPAGAGASLGSSPERGQVCLHSHYPQGVSVLVAVFMRSPANRRQLDDGHVLATTPLSQHHPRRK